MFHYIWIVFYSPEKNILQHNNANGWIIFRLTATAHCKCFRRKLHDVSQRSIPGTISVVLFTTDSSILQIVVLLLQYDKIVVLFTTYNSILRIVVLYSSTTRLSYFLLQIVVLKVRLHLLYDKYVVLLLQSSGN